MILVISFLGFVWMMVKVADFGKNLGSLNWV